MRGRRWLGQSWQLRVHSPSSASLLRSFDASIRLADHPARVRTAEGSRRALSELVWLVLTNVAVDFQHFMRSGGYRYSGDRANRTRPPSSEELVAAHGVRASSSWQLTILRRRSGALADAGRCCLQFLGFFGDLGRKADERRFGAAPATPHE